MTFPELLASVAALIIIAGAWPVYQHRAKQRRLDEIRREMYGDHYTEERLKKLAAMQRQERL